MQSCMLKVSELSVPVRGSEGHSAWRPKNECERVSLKFAPGWPKNDLLFLGFFHCMGGCNALLYVITTL